MNKHQAREMLRLFLTEDVENNRNYHEDTHGITFIGNNFAVVEYATGDFHTFRLTLKDSDVYTHQWYEHFRAQGWDEFIEAARKEDK